MIKTIYIFILSYFLLITTIRSQINYESVSNPVYNFLERMSIKGHIQLNEEIKPFSRIYIAEKLNELKSKNYKFKSAVEIKELDLYIREFAAELKQLGVDLSEYKVDNKIIDLGNDRFGFDKYNRLRLFNYTSNNFDLFIDPILKYEYNSFENGSWWSYSNGIKLYGNLGSNLGFDLQFYDNHPRGDISSSERDFSPLTGYEFYGSQKKGFDFDRLNANLTYSFSNASITIGKDFYYYGNGGDGNLILGNKSPSFPALKLEVFPTTWLKFSYIHGLLNSQILDSTSFRFNPQRNHISTVDKYYVAHLLSLTPYENLNFSIGESVVYSDKFQPIYLVPFIFFRFADHYFTDYSLPDPNINAGNAQIFGSFWYKNHNLNTKFYGSLFIDELTTTRSDYPRAIAYNLGMKIIDPVIPESEITLEYIRINPFVYSHADSAQTYASYGYELGHWIGSNADEIFAKFRKRIIRGLNFDLSFRYIRKGNEEDIAEERYRADQSFLWGDVNTIKWLTAEINYEIIHNFKARMVYEYITNNKKDRYILKTGNFLYFSIGYGI